jgi:CHAT domain-containing protein
MESESDTDSPVRSLEVVQAALDPGQLLLQYRLDEERTILWIVESGGSRCTEIEVGRDSLELTCRRWRAELEAGLASPLASELGELLLDPAAPELERGEQLIVVGDSPLSSIPFSLLRWQGRRLLETHSSSFEVSGSSHCTLKARQGEGIQEKVVAVAYDGAISPPYLRLPVLPAVDAEARSVAALLPDSVLLVGDDARPLALRAALPGTRILHIAAHAGLDAFGEPFILLAPENQRPGLLYRDEIAALPLRGVELVSLAGCETSRLGASEILGDLSGLGAAILTGGARGLMASLWRVDDQSTREFMALFYGELLGAAHSPADALRMAQLAMMADAGFLERDWGAFCVWGP